MGNVRGQFHAIVAASDDQIYVQHCARLYKALVTERLSEWSCGQLIAGGQIQRARAHKARVKQPVALGFALTCPCREFICEVLSVLHWNHIQNISAIGEIGRNASAGNGLGMYATRPVINYDSNIWCFLDHIDFNQCIRSY